MCMYEERLVQHHLPSSAFPSPCPRQTFSSQLVTLISSPSYHRRLFQYQKIRNSPILLHPRCKYVTILHRSFPSKRTAPPQWPIHQTPLENEVFYLILSSSVNLWILPLLTPYFQGPQPMWDIKKRTHEQAITARHLIHDDLSIITSTMRFLLLQNRELSIEILSVRKT